MSSDERLVERATRGDRRAFEAIYERYHQQLYRFCLSMVGNPQDAQDALQNTMVKVLRALPGEERQIQLKPWLYRIARNESVEALRKRRESAELEPDMTLAPDVSEAAEARQRLGTLLADLEQLPERQRAALVMRELSGLDFEQIGGAFETSAAVARQTVYEARLSLRQMEAGREMRCAEVTRELSDADGRVARRREIRAHLRSCADCRAFRDAMARRHEDLAALSPLPLAASAVLLQGALGKAAAGGGVAGGIGAGAGQAVTTSAIVKAVATVAVAAVVGVSAGDRGGVIDLPLPGDGSGTTTGAAESATAGDDAPAEARGAAPKQALSPSHRAEAKANDEKSSSGPDGRRAHPPAKGETQAGHDAPSSSQAGLSPPGGGYGRTASERKGRPEGLPQAADHGQQTAAAKKPPNAAAPAGQTRPGGNRDGESGGSGEAGAKPELPPTAKAPMADPPGQAEDGVGQGGPGDVTPPESQR